MKREEILFYLASNKIYMYLINCKKEYIYDIDTSLFFRLGEISDVYHCSIAIAKILSKMNFGFNYLKPNIKVLYNDICSCDIKFLYESALLPIGYNRIDFVPLTKLVKKIRKDEDLVVSDGDYYTLVNRGEKLMSLNNIDFDPVILGKADTKHIHYSDLDIVWKTFKSHFTNRKSYDIIDIGDDNV